ncbi:hypothetical protein RRG08_006114 [Elysia crispata]|uniref:Uncharacterized protein n=1 Tax=Elysia crispata TaxID=231223 RepID=A0AAE1D3N6_9GAST|nr:hypothetical protein RRG08_006114 [Elysia crispata]
MDDASYSQMSQAQGADLSEETITDWMGMETLYCKHGCCGDNRYPECCEADDAVSQNKFEMYKIIIIVAAGVGGILIITLTSVAIVKCHMKKKRLVRD